MKVKFGDMTISQVKELCKRQTRCDDCPLLDYRGCKLHRSVRWYVTDEEIELPDEEVKDDA